MSLFAQSKMITDETKVEKNYKAKLTLFEMVLFAMFSAMMFISKIMMEFLPNVHLIGMFVVLLTVVYRKKALIPIYIFVLLSGIYGGFAMWWIPYLYVWIVPWAVVMLLPKNMKKTTQMVVYPIVCALHGLLFGVLYAPAQMIMFSFDFKQIVAWVIAGLPFDIVHGISNLFAGLLIYPLSVLLKKLNNRADNI